MFNYDIYIIFEKTKHLKTFYIPILVSRIKLWVWLFYIFSTLTGGYTFFVRLVGCLLMKLGHSKILNNCYQVDYFHTKKQILKAIWIKIIAAISITLRQKSLQCVLLVHITTLSKSKNMKKKNKKKNEKRNFSYGLFRSRWNIIFLLFKMQIKS